MKKLGMIVCDLITSANFLHRKLVPMTAFSTWS